MSSTQRIAVWKGERAKTSGGLTKKDLVKNKRGKIVSKRKSSQASNDNNLGEWLRAKDVSVPKDKMLHPKKGKAAPKPKKAPPPAQEAGPEAKEAQARSTQGSKKGSKEGRQKSRQEGTQYKPPYQAAL